METNQKIAGTGIRWKPTKNKKLKYFIPTK